jgi:Pycsar effector protein
MTTRSDYLRQLLKETREEVTRADAKASIVLAGAGVVVGILLSGFITKDVSLAGQSATVKVLVWVSGILLVVGVALLAAAVYPRVGRVEQGHARWFAELVQYGTDQDALARAVETDRAEDGTRDLHQAVALAQIVDRKYFLTKAGMWGLAIGFALGGAAGILSLSAS